MAHPERFQPGPGCHFRLVARQHRQTGFTLIELLVTMLIGLLLVLAILVVQTNLSRANMQLADAGQRNDQAPVVEGDTAAKGRPGAGGAQPGPA